MNKSALFKKAHKIAKATVKAVGNYMVAFKLALIEVYQEAKKELAPVSSVESLLIEEGFDVWEKGGMKRIYVNNRHLDGFKIVFGLVRKVVLVNFKKVYSSDMKSSYQGERISNSKADQLAASADKAFYCCIEKKWHGIGNLEVISKFN
tara:strand:+ start:113 stop:559 length:447 start_codon:yes stop_codon:yes gene_type:complete